MDGWLWLIAIAAVGVFAFVAGRTVILWFFGLDHMQHDLEELRRTNTAQLKALNRIAAELGAAPAEVPGDNPTADS